MLAVTATKIRTAGGMQSSAAVGRCYEGYLLSRPHVGRGMVLFRDPNGRRMVTTAVSRILSTDDDDVLYVQTENSVYRLWIREALEPPVSEIRKSGTR